MQDLISSVNIINTAPQKPNVGVLVVPNMLPRPELYNSKDARKSFNSLHSDVYKAKSEISYESTIKTPKGVIALGIALVTAVAAVKTGAYSKIKNVLMQGLSRLKAH